MAAGSGGKDSLKFVFELYDGMSGPAVKVWKAMDQVEVATKGAARSVRGFGSDARGAVPSILEWASGLDIAAKAGSALGSILGGALDLGKFVFDALAFRETTLKSFELMVGTKEEAQAIFAEAVKFGAKTPFETKDVVSTYQKLLSAGFSKVEVPIVFQGIGDVAAASGFDTQVLDMLSGDFAKIKARGKLETRELMEVMLAGSKAGLNQRAIFANIADVLKVPVDQVQELMSAGQVSDKVGLFAIVKAMKDISGGQVGNKMLALSTTLTGLLSTIKSIPTDFFLNFGKKFDEGSGFASLKSFMQNVASLFDFSTERGQKLVGVVEDITNSAMEGLFGDFAGADGAERMQKALGKVAETLRTTDFKGIFKGIGDGISTAADSVGPLLYAVKILGAGLYGLAWFFDKFAKTLSLIANTVTLLVQVGLLGNGSQSSYNGMFESLSAQWKDFTGQTEEGAAGPRAPVAVNPAVVARGSGPVNVHVEVKGHHGNPNEVASKVRDATLDALTSAFEQMGIEYGAVQAPLAVSQ